MQNANRYVLFMGLSIGCISMIYFLSLVLHLPFFLIISLQACTVFLIYKLIGFEKENLNSINNGWQKWGYLILAIGLFIIVKKTYLPASKYGGWDAWDMWNYRAKYMADPQNWHRLVTGHIEDSHPDYPLGLPSLLGFIIRLCSWHFTLMIPFALSILIAISIPFLVFIETAKKNIIIASFSLFFFVQDTFYLSTAVSQYADTLLAFFFLCAFICINYTASNKKFLTFTAAFLGCCMWTKNEGILLSFLFMLFYLPVFFSKKNIKYTITGFSLPLLTLLIFKIGYSPPNDIVSSQGHNTLQLILSPDRYKKIYDFFLDNLNQKFYYLKICFYLYLVMCFIEKKLPSKQLFLILSCLLTYMAIYIVSPHDLDWHLSTSQDRLMHQLMPALIYVLAMKFSKIEFSLSKEQLS